MFSQIRDLIVRAIVRSSDDSHKIRLIQSAFFGGELQSECEHFEPYGYTSRPLEGAEAIMLSLAGDRSHAVAVTCFDRRYRPKELKRGEVCIFDNLGRKVFLSAEGIRVEGVESPITVTTKSTVTIKAEAGVTIDAPSTHITGTLTVDKLITGKCGMAISGGNGASVDGNLTTTGDVKAAGISLDNHTHTGVQTGSGSTGKPQ